MIQVDFTGRYDGNYAAYEPISRRQQSFLSFGLGSATAHALVLLFVLIVPQLETFRAEPEQATEQDEAERRRQTELERLRRQAEQRFVFVEPKVDLRALAPPELAPLSDADRRAQAPQRAVTPENRAPASVGDTFDRADRTEPEQNPGPPTPVQPNTEPPKPEPAEQLARALPPADTGFQRTPEISRPAPGALGDALKNLERYVQNETFHNPQGGASDPGATIQFDTKGVDFGAWLRRFVAQVRRNWFVPHAAMTFSGRVVLQFNIHKNGRITDLSVAQASNIEAFNKAASNAILGSNPTAPLPPEYPEPVAFFTVTFYYNERPPD